MVRPFTEGSLEGQVAQNMRLGARAGPKYFRGYSFLFPLPTSDGHHFGVQLHAMTVHFLLSTKTSCFSGSTCSSEIVDLTFFLIVAKEFQHELQVKGRGSRASSLNNQLEDKCRIFWWPMPVI